jgi:hypothetical protein
MRFTTSLSGAVMAAGLVIGTPILERKPESTIVTPHVFIISMVYSLCVIV